MNSDITMTNTRRAVEQTTIREQIGRRVDRKNIKRKEVNKIIENIITFVGIFIVGALFIAAMIFGISLFDFLTSPYPNPSLPWPW